MTKRFITITTLMAVATLFGACGDSPSSDDAAPPADAGAADTPGAAIKGMLALAEAGKWEEYVSTYYGEKHKMTSPEAQTKQVAAQMEKVGAKLVETLKACVDQEPTLSEDGNKASFSNGFALHKDDGRWGFHL